MKSITLLTAAMALMAVSAIVYADNVEVALKDNLDGDLNGYCLDIMGGGQNIDPSQGLQTHTCYSYRGDLGTDQAIDPVSIENGQFHIVAFDVCATMKGLETGATVALTACDGSDLQQFDFAANGNISPKGASGMCLTAGADTSLGRGGTSRHQIKSLTLQTCSDDLAAYQQWFTRTQADYNAAHPNAN